MYYGAAIDLVITGPPCIDYSYASANNKGVRILWGGYLLRFGELMEKVKISPVRRAIVSMLFLKKSQFQRRIVFPKFSFKGVLVITSI